MKVRAILARLGRCIRGLFLWTGLVVSLILVLWILRGPFCFIVNGLFGRPVTEFDSAVWKRAAECDCTEDRLQMVDDYLQNHHPAGMTKAELLDVLGPPEEDPYFRSAEFMYDLGLGFLDNQWLVVDFNDEGFVIRAERDMD